LKLRKACLSLLVICSVDPNPRSILYLVKTLFSGFFFFFVALLPGFFFFFAALLPPLSLCIHLNKSDLH
ncbi:hypothetical protein Tco_0074866, partial [Tanacetum coccineum]